MSYGASVFDQAYSSGPQPEISMPIQLTIATATPMRETSLNQVLLTPIRNARIIPNPCRPSPSCGRYSSRRDDSKVITFLKGGGGVGATTLAVQAGAILAGRYKSEKPKVCLMDLDVQFGTAALYLDLADEVGLADLLETPERVDSDMFRSVLSSHANKLDVLPAPREVMPLEAIEPDAVSKIVKLARKDYRFILLDLPEVWTPWSYRLLQESDQILLVTQFTVSGVRQARRQLDTLKNQGLEEVPLKVVLNRFDKGWGKSGMIKEAEQGLGRPIDYFIANDYKTVSEAINQGACLHEIKSRTKVEKGIRQMIESAAAVSADGDARAEPRLTL